MTTTTYRFTIRPADPFNCPKGYEAIRPIDPPKHWNYGEVDYPEPLPRERAEHFSLVPVRDGKVGVELFPKLRFEGDDYDVDQLGVPEAEDLMYQYGCGLIDRATVELAVKEWADGYEVKVEVIWP